MILAFCTEISKPPHTLSDDSKNAAIVVGKKVEEIKYFACGQTNQKILSWACMERT